MHRQTVDPIREEVMRQSRMKHVCSLVCDRSQLKTWLGRDYGVLIDIGDGSKGVYDILALPEDKVKAIRRVESLAKEHHLRIIWGYEPYRPLPKSGF